MLLEHCLISYAAQMLQNLEQLLANSYLSKLDIQDFSDGTINKATTSRR